jgi:predicted ABC-type transport system involved in lysophospholipase L1 biosynthesis ATPase subunit
MMEITEDGAALVLATHDPEVAAACHRVIDLHRVGGSVASSGTQRTVTPGSHV